MKRMLPLFLFLFLFLFLLLAAGQAQADSNSDYRAGSDFAHQIKGQGTGSIRNFNPQESIPGYNANPDETKYYGGVTAGGDSGLKNDGTTQWATGETGKTITESFMNRPKDILSPDAPFIETGRDVVNRADSIVGNTGQQCSARKINRSEFTNYTCERDLQVEQYCTRTARMELRGSTTWETRTLEYDMSQLPSSEVNDQYVVSITSPVTGEIVSAHYSWERTYLQKSVPMTITVLGTPLYWNAKYSADASFTPVQKTLTAGVAFTSSHPTRAGSIRFKCHTAMKLRLVVRVKKASYTPYVVWSESCPFSRELGKLTKTECTEAGGNRTLVKDGQSYSMYQSCWAYRDTYVTQSADNGTCKTYVDNPACTLVSHQCAFYSEEGACLHEYATYSCESKTSGKVMICGGDVFCLDGECDKAQSGKNSDFGWAVSQLAALAAAGKDVAALHGVGVRAFTGQARFCRKAAAGFSNCCKDGGWGQDVGLAKCSSEEKALAKAKMNKLTVSVGEFCAKKIAGVCLEKKRSYCQFDSKLAQTVQQQGRNGQLHISFGSSKHPDCRGITVDELQQIKFDRLDFTNFYEDLMKNQKIPDSGVLTQKVKEQIADRLKQAGK
ncbi:type-F conjugative transfer system mating-pair stabilization protein TraN [Salmonella enterica subsp. salamae]|uniref:Type-F conjugative transfer system mating-pair stabilization protein TraN n=1 Tax=Salmonella enterica subsp. salamae TaxID=59202 RepID=A0A5Y3XES0_SALER|nr:type-F conjugative transfer system mating-pair stabilization protein TraN [Salmonella enterica subsp. salamae]